MNEEMQVSFTWTDARWLVLMLNEHRNGMAPAARERLSRIADRVNAARDEEDATTPLTVYVLREQYTDKEPFMVTTDRSVARTALTLFRLGSDGERSAVALEYNLDQPGPGREIVLEAP